MTPYLPAIALFFIVGAANDHTDIGVYLVVAVVSLIAFVWGMKGEKYE